MGEEKHVRDTHAGRAGMAWCGERLTLEWRFEDVDHVALSERSGATTVPCRGCVDAIIRALRPCRRDRRRRRARNVDR